MKVLLVDDHKLFAGALKTLLEAGGTTVVGTACDGASAVAMARELRPDLILMDITMAGCDGLTATRLIKAEFPAMKIVMLTMNDDDETLFNAIRSGASGYCLRTWKRRIFSPIWIAWRKGNPLFRRVWQIGCCGSSAGPGARTRVGAALLPRARRRSCLKSREARPTRTWRRRSESARPPSSIT